MIDLKTATSQEVFEYVANHLLHQGEQCVTKKGKCAYKNGKLSCAAGCLIPDEEYNVNMEGESWCNLDYANNFPDHMLLIENLQSLHDSFVPSVWKTQLINIAIEYELDYDFLQ